MPALILISNLIAIGIGGYLFITAAALVRTYRLPYLGQYLHFLTFAIIAGFFDWVIFDIVTVAIPDAPPVLSDRIYHIFWDILGFPASLLSLFFLFHALEGMMEIELDRRLKTTIRVVVIILCVASIAIAIFTRIGGHTLAAWNIHMISYAGLPALIGIVLVLAFFQAHGIPNTQRWHVRRMILMLAAGYIVWYTLPMAPGMDGTIARCMIVWYYLMLVFPTLALRWQLESQQHMEVFAGLDSASVLNAVEQFKLTEREKEVLVLLSKGKSYRAICDELFVSLQTVKNYISRIYKKCNVKNRVELYNVIQNRIEQKR